MSDCDDCSYHLVANDKDMCARPEKERICVKVSETQENIRKPRPHRLESPLMKAPDRFVCCVNCWYHEKNRCNRRERVARWDPNNFVCGDFGLKDEEPTKGTLLSFGIWIE